MKKLPGIYHEDIDKNISNNQNIYYISNEIESINGDTNIEEFIDNLFKEDGYIFNKPLLIVTKDKKYDTAIVKKNNNKIYTLTDDIIDINDIISIKKTK
jgi:hypothetical protein